MGWEGIVAITSCAGLLLSIGAMVYALGKIVARLEALEGRVKEDRDKNESEHKDFSETARIVSGLQVSMQNVEKALDEVKLSLSKILDRLPVKS